MGALVLLEQHAAAASADLQFTATISSTYDTYLFELVDVQPTTDATHLTLQVSTDGGSTWQNTNYQYAFVRYTTGGTGSVINSTSDSSLRVCQANSNNSGFGFSGELRLFQPGSSSTRKNFTYHGVALLSDGNFYTMQGGGLWSSASAVNAVRFIQSSGTLATGTIRAYGVAK